MKYILLMHTPTGGPYKITEWPSGAIEAHMEFMKRLNRKLVDTAEIVGA